MIRFAKWRLLGVGVFGFASAVVGFYIKLGGAHEREGYCGLAGALAALILCVWWIARDRRLIIADDCVQLVQGKSRVLGNVPYDAIVGIYFTEGRGGPFRLFYKAFVEFRLNDGRDERLFWPGVKRGDATLVIDDHFASDAEEIRRMVRNRWDQFRAQLESAHAPAPEFPADHRG